LRDLLELLLGYKISILTLGLGVGLGLGTSDYSDLSPFGPVTLRSSDPSD